MNTELVFDDKLQNLRVFGWTKYFLAKTLSELIMIRYILTRNEPRPQFEYYYRNCKLFRDIKYPSDQPF